MIAELLYSWIDVQAAMQASVGEWPDALLSARAYWDGLVIGHAAGGRGSVARWLADHFDARWQEDAGAAWIRLESRPGGPPRTLAVQYEESEDAPPLGMARRSFRNPDTAMRRRPMPLPQTDGAPRIFAWHSFKGGVGRTTAALQFARLVARRDGARVLLVDMDFEAPGITWMVRESRLPAPPIAMSDVLALIHSAPPEELPEVVSLIGHHLRDSLVDGLVVLPALRGTQREPDVRPEHLEGPGTEPLADVLGRIAAAARVTHVVVDLRAGRSELAASLLLDRRVARVLVTTIAGQSMKGTREMLREMEASFPEEESDPAITVVLSRLSTPIPESFRDGKRDLIEATERLLSDVAGDAPFPLRFTAALHDESLLALPLDWADAVARLDAVSILDPGDLPVDLSFAQWAEEAAPAPLSRVGAAIDEARRTLGEFASRMVLAEAAEPGPFLNTGFLRNLVQAHRSKLPVAVAEGAKGAGKTFTFLRMVRLGTWRRFAGEVGEQSEVDGRVLPLAWPANLGEPALRILDDALGAPRRASEVRIEFRERLDRAKRARSTLSDWRAFWIEEMVIRAGVASPAELSSSPAERRVFVVDGIEDLFPQIHADETWQMCLRALLQETPAWIRAAGGDLGLVVFARPDQVRAAIPQNTEQFRSLYRAYELRWDRREALRLVMWIGAQADVVGANAGEDDALLRVWGRKLGADSSREAISRVWVLDALSTRKEEVQARDLVRLVAEAARRSVGQAWDDRILAPQAIRDALEAVGRERIGEILEEHPDLGMALEHFRGLAPTLRVPFAVAQMRDDRDRSALLRLEDAGIAWREGSEYWLVSLYRRGLGIQLQPHRRERVLR